MEHRNNHEFSQPLRTRSDGGGRRQRRDKFIPYTVLTVAQAGRSITVPGSQPKSALAYSNLQLP